MKKLIYLFLLMSATIAKAQEGVVFKMKFLPEHDYQSAMSVSVNLKVNITGSDELIEKLKSQGIAIPLTAVGNANINGDIKTGKKTADNGFPLTADFGILVAGLSLNGNEIDAVKGKTVAVKVYAKSDADGKMKADSSFFDGKRDTSGKAINNILSMGQREINFPNRPLKVGDTFDQNAPMDIPGAANTGGPDVKLSNIHTIYTLTKIDAGKAYFDMMISGDVKIDLKKVNVSLSASGPGKMVYSIKDNFPVHVSSKVSLKFNVTIGGSVVDGTADFTMTNDRTIK